MTVTRSLSFPKTRYLHAGSRVLNRVEGGTYSLFQVKPLGSIIGAEVEGIDLRNPISKEQKEELNRALLEWKVLFFRDQDITSEQHVAFAKQWGELESHPFIPKGSADEIDRFAKDVKMPGMENIWHTDVTWRLNPAKAAVLRLVEVPPAGGDTIWADMAAAYDNLPENVKEKIEGLTAIHDFIHAFGQYLPPEILKVKQVEFPPAEHPIVRTHPETGRKTLFVNAAFTTHIIGVDKEEGEKLLQFLFQQAAVPEYQVRFQWKPNSIAIWDNRATQHYAVNDYFPHRRVAERVSIIGDKPY